MAVGSQPILEKTESIPVCVCAIQRGNAFQILMSVGGQSVCSKTTGQNR